MSNDSQEFCGVLAGRLSHAMLPHDREMPSQEISRIIDEHLVDSGNVGTLLMTLEDRIVELEAAMRAMAANRAPRHPDDTHVEVLMPVAVWEEHRP